MSPCALSFRDRIRDNFVFDLNDVTFDKKVPAFDVIDGAVELVPVSLSLEKGVDISPFSHEFLYKIEERFDCGGENGGGRVAALIDSGLACV